jgi:two-component system NarL family response regulator
MTKEPSAREQQVLARIAQGKTSKQIAAELGISLRTVNTHRENIAKKIGSSSLAAMIRFAIEYEQRALTGDGETAQRADP